MGTVTDESKRQSEIVGQPPRIRPLQAGEMGAEARAIAARIRSAAGLPDSAEVSEYVATLLKHPLLYEKHAALGTELLAHGTLTGRQRELAILRTGWLCGAPYEWGEHVGIAKRNGVVAEDIARVAEGSSAQGWNDEDKAILQAAEELHADAAISDATWQRLEAFLDERQLIELPYLIGNYTKVAFVQNALRLRLNPGNQGLSAR
ncbi:MAG: carboxymuconolactone decarboxylase family protein [Sphingomonadales bacterium]|nr:carboxymuconolactone decarboxylase family protein [Sphingomonadales bacterium]